MISMGSLQAEPVEGWWSAGGFAAGRETCAGYKARHHHSTTIAVIPSARYLIQTAEVQQP